MQNTSEYIAVLDSRSGRLARPRAGTPFSKYFNECERFAIRTDVSPYSSLLEDLFPLEEYPHGPVFHRIERENGTVRRIVMSWCVFPIADTQPAFVPMSINLPPTNTMSTPRTRICSADRLRLLNVCYGGANNVRYNVHQTALIGSLVVDGADDHRMIVCIPRGHPRLEEIVHSLQFKRLFPDNDGRLHPYLFNLTLIQNGPRAHKSKSGIPISNTLFFALFWGDRRFMALLTTFVPARSAPAAAPAGNGSSVGTPATSTDVTTSTTSGPQPSRPRAYHASTGGKELISVQRQQEMLRTRVIEARDRLGDLLAACLQDTTSSDQEMKVSLAILSALMRDARGMQGEETMSDETGLSMHEFADIVDSLDARYPGYQPPPCQRVYRILEYSLDKNTESFSSFTQVNDGLFEVLRETELISDASSSDP